jgi:hypothetical protein
MNFSRSAFRLLLLALCGAGIVLSGCKDQKEFLRKDSHGQYHTIAPGEARSFVNGLVRDGKAGYCKIQIVRTAFYGSSPTDLVKATFVPDTKSEGENFFRLDSLQETSPAFHKEVLRQLSEKFNRPMNRDEVLDLDLKTLPSA